MPSKTLLAALLSMLVLYAVSTVDGQGLYMSHAYCTMSIGNTRLEYTPIYTTSSVEGLGCSRMRLTTFRLRIPREHPQQAYRRIHGSVIAIFALTTWDRMRIHAVQETIGTITTIARLDIPAI